MSAKFRNFKINYKTAFYVLIGIVIVQGFFLAKNYVKKHPAKKTIARPALTKEKKKPLAPKVSQKKPAPAPVLPSKPAASRGKIAIIVDDSGYNIRDCDHLHEIANSVTISILPNLKHSTDIAQCAHAYQKEVMLHFPLEPHENMDEYPENYLVTTQMPKGLVIDRLEESLKSVPYADGVNNHMGSKATEDQHLMSIIFAQLVHKDLFFVDSRVTSKTICPKLAREMGEPFAQRDVFLDNENERAAIERQFAELARVAEKKGFAIGIGHTRELTWQIIKEQTEKLTQEGFEIVPVRTIINENND